MLSHTLAWWPAFYFSSTAEKWKRIRDGISRKIAWCLPKRLIYWAMVRGISSGTVGKYGDTHPSTLSGIEAMKRWADDHRL